MTRTLTLATACLLAGCGGGDPDLPPPPSAPPGGPPKAAQTQKPGQPSMPAPPKAPEPEKKGPTVVRTPRPATGDVADGPDPNLSVAVAFVDPAGPDLDVTPASERPENQARVSASPLGGYGRAYVAPPEGAVQARPDPPEGFAAQPGSPVDADGRPARIVHEPSGREMVLVPGGPFRFGREPNAATVTLSPFYIDRTEVTVGEWERYRGAAGGRTPRPSNADAPADHPAVGLKPRDITAYAEWAGLSLPTEAQWEKAARGPASLDELWGRGRPLWSRPRTPGELHAVDAYPNDRSVYGVLGLAGNAREWTADPWDGDPFAEAAGSTDWAGPKRPQSPGERVVRGEADGYSVTSRAPLSVSDADDLVGFRCVLNLGG